MRTEMEIKPCLRAAFRTDSLPTLSHKPRFARFRHPVSAPNSARSRPRARRESPIPNAPLAALRPLAELRLQALPVRRRRESGLRGDRRRGRVVFQGVGAPRASRDNPRPKRKGPPGSGLFLTFSCRLRPPRRPAYACETRRSRHPQIRASSSPRSTAPEPIRPEPSPSPTGAQPSRRRNRWG